MSVLRVDDLCKEYVRNDIPFRAVDTIFLRVERGDILGIVGQSGCGKTTFLNLISGLIKPSSGSVKVNDVDILALSDRKLSLLRNQNIGYVPQGQSLLANLTVFDNVRLPYYMAKRNDNVAGRTAFLLEEFGISHLAKIFPPQLSGGEMRRVAIARAMMNRPVLLLADEPTGDLDIGNIHAVMDIFAALADKGVAVVFSTHEREAVQRAGRVLEMTSGKASELQKLEK